MGGGSLWCFAFGVGSYLLVVFLHLVPCLVFHTRPCLNCCILCADAALLPACTILHSVNLMADGVPQRRGYCNEVCLSVWPTWVCL